MLVIERQLLSPLTFRDMPSSFTGAYGKIAYSLKAVLSRSMRIDKKDSTKINFIAKGDPSITSLLMVCVDL